MNIAQMCAASRRAFPKRKAIAYRDVSLTFEQLDDLSTRCAGALSALGASKGAKVALLLEKTPELVIAFVACAKLGAMVVPLNYQLRPSTIARMVVETGGDVIIAASKYVPLLSEVPKEHKVLRKIVKCGETKGNEGLVWARLLDEAPDDFEPVETDDDTPFYLNFTSGSTGEPKAAVTTHGNLFWNTISSVETLGLRHNDVHLCMFPAYLHPARDILQGCLSRRDLGFGE